MYDSLFANNVLEVGWVSVNDSFFIQLTYSLPFNMTIVMIDSIIPFPTSYDIANL